MDTNTLLSILIALIGASLAVFLIFGALIAWEVIMLVREVRTIVISWRIVSEELGEHVRIEGFKLKTLLDAGLNAIARALFPSRMRKKTNRTPSSAQ